MHTSICSMLSIQIKYKQSPHENAAFASIAQLAEHWIENPSVSGSNPLTSTK